MKLAISASEDHLDAPVDPRFGRAPYFIIVDTDTMNYEVVPNQQNLQAPQGAGIQAASAVARHKPDAVLTGNCGPKAFQTLQAAGIAVVVQAGGTVRSAVQDYLDGRLKPSSAPNVPGHWS